MGRSVKPPFYVNYQSLIRGDGLWVPDDAHFAVDHHHARIRAAAQNRKICFPVHVPFSSLELQKDCDHSSEQWHGRPHHGCRHVDKCVKQTGGGC